MLDRQQTVAHVVLDHAECAQVFQRHHIDFCCRGGMSLEAAASARGVDIESLVEELSRAIDARAGGPPTDRRALSTPRLIAHIVSTHHEYLRTALPFIGALALKVGRVHGAHNPKLVALADAVGALSDALLPHLDEEELRLFPMLVSGHGGDAAVVVGLASMTQEHLAVAALLERIQEESDGFRLPDWACTSYRTLFSELMRLESDIFTHVHLENHVLLPRFTAPSA